MSKLQHFIKGNNKIAYRYYKRSKKNLVFIHGLMSDMNGQKSIFFNNFCRKKNFSFLCFDFSGHGKSSGDFIEFGIKDWYEDLKSLINHLNLKNITLIGSSMGGWVGMLYALNFAKNVDRLIGIAAAPDFTKDLLWKELSDKNKDLIRSNSGSVFDTSRVWSNLSFNHVSRKENFPKSYTQLLISRELDSSSIEKPKL